MRQVRAGRQWLLLLVLALVLPACGGGNGGDTGSPTGGDTEGADEQTEAAALESVGSLTVGSIANPPIFAMLLPYVAQDAGFFEKYGVDVQLRDMETGVDAARAVRGGDLDAAFSPTGPVMTFAGTDAEVSALMGLDNIDWVVGTVNPDITSCADLEGETIAVDSVGGARYSVLEIILASCDLSIDDVETVSLPGAPAIQAVAAGQLDTAVLHIDDLHVIQEQAPDKELQIVERLKDIRPDQHYLVFWSQPETVEAKREELVRALAAFIDATRFMQDEANHDEVVEIAKVTGHSAEVARAALQDFLEIEFWPIDRHGLPQEKIEATIAQQVRLENIPEGSAPNYDDVVDTSLWEDAFELVKEHGDH